LDLPAPLLNPIDKGSGIIEANVHCHDLPTPGIDVVKADFRFETPRGGFRSNENQHRSVLELRAVRRRDHLDGLADALATEPTVKEDAWRIAIDWARTQPRHEAIEALATSRPSPQPLAA